MPSSAADAWSGASYERIAATFAPIHDRVIEALAPTSGGRVLDADAVFGRRR